LLGAAGIGLSAAFIASGTTAGCGRTVLIAVGVLPVIPRAAAALPVLRAERSARLPASRSTRSLNGSLATARNPGLGRKDGAPCAEGAM